MKGLELPISVMIIIVICLLVFLAIVALFMGVWSPGRDTLALEAAKNSACQMLVSLNCGVATNNVHVNNFDADGNGVAGDTGDTLEALCKWYNINNNEPGCKALCGCGTSGTAGGSPFECVDYDELCHYPCDCSGDPDCC